MGLSLPAAYLQLTDKAFIKLKSFGSGLKPIDEKNAWFFQIVFELIDSTFSNYDQLKIGYNTGNDHLLAWACRNMLELIVFTKYVLASEANARRFAQDRLIDGCDIITSLRELELHLDPKSDTALLDDALKRMQTQMNLEGVTAKRFLSTRSIASTVGMKEDFDCMNRVCSKLVHPTAWSILAVNKGENAFTQARSILFQAGAMYGCDVYASIEDHHKIHGMRPKP